MKKDDILSKLFSLDNYISHEEAKEIDDVLCHLDYTKMHKDEIQTIDDYLSCRINSLNSENINGEENGKLIVLSDLLRKNHLT